MILVEVRARRPGESTNVSTCASMVRHVMIAITKTDLFAAPHRWFTAVSDAARPKGRAAAIQCAPTTDRCALRRPVTAFTSACLPCHSNAGSKSNHPRRSNLHSPDACPRFHTLGVLGRRPPPAMSTILLGAGAQERLRNPAVRRPAGRVRCALAPSLGRGRQIS
jgi:hypothetical protein